MTSKDISQLSLKEIELKAREFKDKLLNLRVRKQTGQLEKPHQFRALRRDIARLQTFIAQKQMTKE
jgi:large subunit ribosomal protein L29